MSQAAAIIAAAKSSQLANHRAVAGAALFVYDWFLLVQAEISENVYWSRKGTRSVAMTVYPVMKLMAILYFVGSLYQRVYPSVTQTRCLLAVWATGIAMDIGFTSIIKTILVLRLRALYRHERKVTLLLYFLMTVELLCALVALVGFITVNTKYPAAVPFPFPGCWQRVPKPPFSTFYKKSGLVLWVSRFATTSIELVLMLQKFAQVLGKERRGAGESLWTAVAELRRITPVLYVFYRDGALLFIPIFVINTFGCFSMILPASVIGSIDWSMWLLLTYQICGSRLILNIRQANGKLTGTMVPQYLSTLRFNSTQATTHQTQESMDGFVKPGYEMAPMINHMY
ncbi:hypothetical protein P691DRAFT_809452 [Macrolepiota fuliginosa MF-IS2]|uniref:Uncharacterized protein n=1 Tax=Macrolepiota fuliginosa MF-IS2 TaxID=1400762 RepID=A0A9P6BZ23_9AGAR|nr:hypothetical protein P691DRAFT_809452 [Macrolepiota fuliginosa MF-IS2]